MKYLLFDIVEKPFYLIWWILADIYPDKTYMCEVMASLVCDTSLLRSTDYRLKRKTFSNRICDKCSMTTLESVWHIVMQCPFYSDDSTALFNALRDLDNETSRRIVNEPADYFFVVMGKQPAYANVEEMVEIWLLSGYHISKMYKRAIIGRR